MIRIFEEEIVGLARKHRNVVALCGDFSTKLGLTRFSETLPERYFNFGLGEENVLAAASGFVVRGKLPFVVGYAGTLLGENWKILRDLVCYPNLNVKIVGFGAGLSVGQEGVGLQATEDLAIARALPNMKILIPADEAEFSFMLREMMDDYGPTYLRLGDFELPVLAQNGQQDDADLVIFSFGIMLHNSYVVAEMLRQEGMRVRVVNVSQLKPLDEQLVKSMLGGARQVVTVEDHSVHGGLGSALAELVADRGAGRLLRVGLKDRFAESGKTSDLHRRYGLNVDGIYQQIKSFLGKL